MTSSTNAPFVWNFDGFRLPMFTVYDHPKDYPKHFVVRLWDMDRWTPQFSLHNTLEEAREAIPADMVMLVRHPDDDPNIVEVWL